MGADPISRLDKALVEDPYGPGFDELRAVAGDLLLAQGEARGELIALERGRDHGQLDAETFASQVRAWLERHAPELDPGPEHDLAYVTHFGVRGGRVLALDLDLRATDSDPDQTLTERTDAIVRGLARAPVCAMLQRLRVTLERDDLTEVCLERLTLAGRHLPLEELSISTSGRALGHQTRQDALRLRKRLPQLWFATRFARVAPLIDPRTLDEPAALALEVLAGQRPSRYLRIRIGRGLSSGAEQTTRAACELIAELGASGEVFRNALEQLLAPEISHAAPWIRPHLSRFRPWAERLQR